MQFLKDSATFFDYHYWINFHPVPLGPSLVGGAVIFFAWFLIAALALRIAARGMRKNDPLKTDVLRRFSKLLAATGALGLLFLFFAYEQLPLLGMRFWFLLLLALFLILLGRAVAHVVREYPRLRAELDERARLERYLPKKK